MPIYEQECSACGHRQEYYSAYVSDRTRPCEECGSLSTDRLYSLSTPRVFEPFTTRNLTEDGKPVTIRGPGQLRQMEAEHGVKLVDDPKGPPPQTKIPPVS